MSKIPKLKVLPLIPKGTHSGSIGNLDASSAVRETLRHYLELETDRTSFKGLDRIKQSYEKVIEDIKDAESELLMVQAKNLSSIKQIQTDEYDKHKLSQQLNQINFEEVCQTSAEKYNLIRSSDLNITMENILMLKDSQFSTYNPCCTTDKMVNVKKPERAVWEREFIEKREIARFKPRHDVVLEMKPKEVIFHQYEIGHKYIKKLKIFNKSTKIVSFFVEMALVTPSVFSIDFKKEVSNCYRVAPGTYAEIIIKYKCIDLDDHTSHIRIEVKSDYPEEKEHNIFLFVPILASRAPPTIISEGLLKKNKWQTPIIPSSPMTIDCGTRFLGSKYSTHTCIYNSGSDAIFVIATELSWEFSNVKNMNHLNEVHLTSFTIYPSYFKLPHYGKKELEIGFMPTCEGAHVEKLYVICDNLTIRTLDLLGEAVLFNQEDFCLFGKVKSYDIDEEDLFESRMYIDLGVIYRGGTTQSSFEIHCKSPVDVCYGWKNVSLNISQVNQLPANSYNLIPDKGIICSCYSPKPTKIKYYADKYILPGTYKSLLSLVAKNIPKVAVIDENVVRIHNECFADELTSIEVCYIEVSVHIEEPYIIIEPFHVDFSEELYKTATYPLKVTNYSSFPINCYWELPTSECVDITITPERESLAIEESKAFTLTVEGLKHCKIEELLKCIVVEGRKCFKFIIRGTVSMQSIDSMYLAYSYGGIRAGVKYQNLISLTASDLVKGIILDGNELIGKVDEDLEITLTPAITDNLINVPQICESNDINICYTPRTQLSGQNVSIIKWTCGPFSAYTDLFWFSQEVSIILTPELYELPVVYINVEHKFKVLLTNKSFVGSKFKWGQITGSDCSNVKIKVSKEFGKVDGFETLELTFSITCLEPGLIEFLKIPCFIQFTEKPIILSIKGEVKDLNVEYTWPAKSETTTIVWPMKPPKKEASVDFGPTDSRCCICNLGAKFSSTNIPLSQGEFLEDHHLRYVDSNTSSIPYLNWPVVGGRYYYDKFKNRDLYVDFLHSWGYEDLKRRIIEAPTNEEKEILMEWFSEKAIVINLKAHEIAKPVTVEIRNPTPIETTYYAEVEEFMDKNLLPKGKNENENSPMSPAQWNRMLRRTQIFFDINKDQFEQKLQENCGLVLVVENNQGKLDSETVNIHIQAYSNCWGVYFDHLRIDIPELPSFHIPILINVRGKPAWFTLSPYCDQPILRFGSIANFETRELKVYVYNNTFLNLKISWTSYNEIPLIPEKSPFLVPNEDGYFSLNIEFHPRKDEDLFKVHLVDYLGELDHSYYKVYPRVSYLKPKTKVPLTISVSTLNCWFDVYNLETVLKGGIYGVIYIDPDENSDVVDLNCYRPDGFEIDPLILKLEATKIVSLMTLNTSEKDLFIFKIPGSRVILAPNHVYLERRMICMENTGSGKVLCSFSTTGLLRLVELRLYHHSDHIDIFTDENPTIYVKPDEKVEIILELALSKKIMISIIQRNMRLKSKSYISDSKNPNLLIVKQENQIEQSFPFQIHISPPVISVSTSKLFFGVVHLNETKYLSFRLRSDEGDEVFMVKIISEWPNIFSVKPLGGLLRPRCFIDIDVAFTPRECLHYTGRIIIHTNYPRYGKDVLLEGSGTWDSKFSLPVQE